MSNDIRLVQLSNYVRPKLEENKSKNWVLNGKNNSFYQYVIDRYNGSPTNAAIISSYVDLIYGRGLSARNKNLTSWINFKVILSKKELRKIIADFELFGEASMQIVKAKNGKDLGAIYHLPKQLVVPSLENEDGEITSYWYSRDWTNLNKNPPEEFPAFGTSKENIEIYCIKPYKAGKNYFSDPDYLSALPYAEMEEELANFYINSIKSGLSPAHIINVPGSFHNTPEEKTEFERKVNAKLTGSSNAFQKIFNYMSGSEAITVGTFPTNEQMHKQWEYLTGESRQQIMTGHKVVSPKLFGIMSEGGLGNNANELDEAEGQLMKRVIAPKQTYILEALEDILTAYNIGLDLYFIPLSEPQQTTQMSSDEKKKTDLDLFLSTAEQEDLENYDLISVEKYDEDSVEIDLAKVPSRLPLAPSEIDNDVFKVRFQYAGSLDPKREFCRKMIALKGGVFRKEDIVLASSQPVNKGWGPNGKDTYDILKYKGGGDCHHFWQRKVYLKKSNKYITIEKAQRLLKELGVKSEIPTSGEPLSTIKPKDMPNRGFLIK